MTPATTDILFDISGGIGVVTLNRPQARNALTFAMYDRLVEICESQKIGGAAKVLVVTGAGGKAFAAGTDISEFRSFSTPEQGLAYEKRADEIFKAIEACPIPIIAAISGACTGGGAGISACCDIRLGTRDMKWGFPIARTLGNCLSAATLKRLVATIGQAKTVDLIFTSRLMEADEALASGLVKELYADHAAVMERAMALAREIAGFAPLTLSVTKELLRRLRDQGDKVDDHDLVAKIYTSADFREGLESFLAKRKPNWQGR